MTRGQQSITVALVATMILIGISCSGETPEPATPPAEAEPAPAAGDGQTQVPLTGLLPDDRGADLPPGHPPVDSSTAVPPPPPAEAGAALDWAAPEGWVEVPPSSSMRKAQYRVPGPGGDAECVVFYFGPGQGGDPMANAIRWAGQFQQPDGRPSTDVMTTETRTVGDRSVLTVEVTGTYTNPMVDNVARPDHMLLGAIVEGPDANWFFKLTGPTSTVSAQRDAFGALIESVR